MKRPEVLPFAALFLLVFLPLGWSFVHSERSFLMSRLTAKSESLARNLAEIVGDDLAMGDYVEAQKIVDAAKQSDQDVAYLTLVGFDGTVYASSDHRLVRTVLPADDFNAPALKVSSFTRRPTPDPNIMEADTPIRFQTYSAGVLRLGISTRVVDNVVLKSIQTLLVLASFSLLFAALAYRLRVKTLALADANARLEGLDRAKSEFLGIVSHELRTPLTSISGFLRTILERGSQVSEQRRLEYLRIMHHESARLIRLVNDLLDITNIELGHYELEREAADLSAMARGVAESIRAHNPRANVSLVGVDKPLVVSGDADKLKQVFINLLNNAVKYSPESSPVTVKLRGADGGVEVSVLDRGPGIEERHLEHLFDKFYRVGQPSEAETGGKGSGLGLAIAKKILELHGGRIAVRSTVGQGSEFMFWIPNGPAVAVRDSGKNMLEYPISG